MFHHVKDLQFNARVGRPDPKFAGLLLEQFGGPNGELKAAMQYFAQSFAVRPSYPDHYDLLVDIATEELSHLEIVGATITMLLDGVNSELKDAAESSTVTKFMHGTGAKEQVISDAFSQPQLLVRSGGGPTVTDCQGVPWSGTYVNANGDPTVDFRSNIAAESRAKIIYEYLMKFTDDEYVQQSLGFLMTREIAHAQMFTAALDSIQPNFPPGIRQGDPRYTHTYFNMSDGSSVRGPWNEGRGPWPEGEEWSYIENPIEDVRRTQGETKRGVEGSKRSMEGAKKLERELSARRSRETKPRESGVQSWSAPENR
jgi:Mn-containing catalase